jgi:hypothetical protein
LHSHISEVPMEGPKFPTEVPKPIGNGSLGTKTVRYA